MAAGDKVMATRPSAVAAIAGVAGSAGGAATLGLSRNWVFGAFSAARSR